MQVKKQTLQFWVIGFVTIMALLFLVVIIGSKNNNNDTTSNATDGKVIEVQASRYKFNVETIKVKQGEKVTLNIDNLDLPHGIVIPELSLYGTDTITFEATEKGTYDFYCANPHCGSGHDEMRGQIVIE
jgi:heme/copper-type cytochrome/quinol oxidase subunit 2